MKKTVFRLAFSKLRYHKSRTLLTGISIMLTTMLLMAIGTTGIGSIDMSSLQWHSQTIMQPSGSHSRSNFPSCQSILMWNP